MSEAKPELPEQLILARQAGLLKTFYQLVAALTVLALLLIAFLPGFATTESNFEPFVRNVIVLIDIGLLYWLLTRGMVLASIFGTIGSCAVIASYTIWMESPQNMQMMALIMFPTLMAGLLPRRSHFWIVYALNVALMLFTVWIVIQFKAVVIPYPSIVTLVMLLSLMALLIDTMSSSYRNSISTTFNQLQAIHQAEERIVKLDADLGEAISEKQRAETASQTGRLALEVAGAGSVTINNSEVEVSQEFVGRYGFEPPTSTEQLVACIHEDDRLRFIHLIDAGTSPEAERLEGDFRLNREKATWWLFVLERTSPEDLQGIIVDSTARIEEQRRQEERDFKLHESQRLESLGVLAGAIAHDFNNLLHVIMLNADLAKQNLEPESKPALSIERLLTTVDRAAELCSELLAYSGKGSFTIEPFDAEQLVEEMHSLMDISTPKGVTIEHVSDGTRPIVNGDITQIRQVVMNLITNAGEAIGNSGGTIKLFVGSKEYDDAFLGQRRFVEDVPAGEYAYIRVQDDGCGMDEEYIGRIFDPFFSTKETGHGLGLSAVLGIVRSHKGTISIESQPNSQSNSQSNPGTDILLLLPLSDVAPANDEPADDQHKNGERQRLILFADDESEIRTLAHAVLENIGYSLLEAENGQQAIDIFSERHDDLDLVILDLIMPNKTGLEAYFEMNEIDPFVPVVFSSGFNENEALDKLPDKGRSAFLKKPYMAEDLVTFVKNILGDRVEPS